MEEVEEWSETQFHNSGVLGMPTLSIYIPPAKYAKQLRADGSGGWVSAASAHYVDVEAADWSLPEEAFPLRTAPPPAPPPPAAGPAPRPTHNLKNNHAFDEKDPTTGGNQQGGISPGGSSSPGSGSSSDLPPLDHHHSMVEGELVVGGEGGEGGYGGGALWVAGGEARGACALEVAPLLACALRLHAHLGDVQTAAMVMIVLQERRSDLFPYIDESLQEQWLLGYIEFLQRHKMWNVATEVVKSAWLNNVWCISQQSTSVAVCCARCGRRTRPRAPCDSCQGHGASASAAPSPPSAYHAPVHTDICAVCHRVVRGLYAWCQGCSHGGHLRHMRDWMQRHQLCPAGCGHRCQLG